MYASRPPTRLHPTRIDIPLKDYLDTDPISEEMHKKLDQAMQKFARYFPFLTVPQAVVLVLQHIYFNVLAEAARMRDMCIHAETTVKEHPWVAGLIRECWEDRGGFGYVCRLSECTDGFSSGQGQNQTNNSIRLSGVKV